MADLIFKFSENNQLKIKIDPLALALRYLVCQEKNIKKLAFKLGVSKNVINLWLKNIKKPNEENLQKICDLTKVEKSIIKNW